MRTYKALLRGDRLEWIGDGPEPQTDTPLSVHVSVLGCEEAQEGHTRGHAMANLLEKMAERQTLSRITDPVKWQRETREERVLPGRDG